MNYPIINKPETYKGVQFFLESDSFKNWLVAPTNNPWTHNVPTSVGGRTIINARKDYIVDSKISEEFSKSKGNVTVNPISLTKYLNNLELDFSFNHPHQIKLDVLDGLPYPSVIFSATLLNSASDYDQLLQEITNRLKSNTLLKGELVISFQGINIINKSLLVYNLRNILITIDKNLKTQEKTKWNLYKEINNLITSNLNSFVNTEFAQLTESEKDKLIDYLCTYLTNIFISTKTNELYFDREISFEEISLRNPLEFQDKNVEKNLLNTSFVTETLHLK